MGFGFDADVLAQQRQCRDVDVAIEKVADLGAEPGERTEAIALSVEVDQQVDVGVR